MAISRTLRDAILIICGGAALGLVGNELRDDGVPLGRPPVRAVEGECAPPTAQSQWIAQQAALRLIGNPDVTFIDARPTEEFVQAHVAGAFSLPFHGTEAVPHEALSVLEGSRTVITYCDTHGGCTASLALAQKLTEAGHRDVRVLEGGWPSWLQNGYPAEAGECRLCPDPPR